MWEAIQELMEQFDEAVIVLDADGEIAVVNAAARERLARGGGDRGECRVVRASVQRGMWQALRQLDDAAAALPVVLAIRNKERYLYISPAHETIYGDGPEAFYLNVNEFLTRVHPEDVEQVKAEMEADLTGNPHEYRCRYRHASGEWRWMHVRVQPYRDPHSRDLLVASLAEDVTEIREKRGRRKLLGLVDKAEFREVLSRCTDGWISRPGSALFAVAFIDLARFRAVNDSFGYSEGDRLLEEVARRIEQTMPPESLMAGFGSDLFALLMKPFASMEQAEAALREVLAGIAAPFSFGDQAVSIVARAGMAFPRDIKCTADVLLRDADAALQLAKQSREPLVVSRISRAAQSQELATLEFDLDRAVAQDEFFFEFQPVFRPDTGEVILLEALVRWRHPRLGVISPTSFISLAEDTGLVLRMDMQGLDRLWRQLEYWHSVEPRVAELPVSINISGRHFPNFVFEKQFHQLLKKPVMQNSKIIFEITESVFVESNPRTAAALERLRGAGVQIWLDDFGDGFSSFRYLAHFPVDGIKISESFVKQCAQQEKSRVILSALQTLARGLNVQTVVEGVENREQFETLKTMGFDAIQGYYLSKPLGVKDIPRLIAEGAGNVRVRRKRS